MFIDIFSPFFDILSIDKIFENFSINILLKDIEETNLELDYISTFDNLNNSKSKYIIRTIFDYIKDKTFGYKLFFYSKPFQKKKYRFIWLSSLIFNKKRYKIIRISYI